VDLRADFDLLPMQAKVPSGMLAIADGVAGDGVVMGMAVHCGNEAPQAPCPATCVKEELGPLLATWGALPTGAELQTMIDLRTLLLQTGGSTRLTSGQTFMQAYMKAYVSTHPLFSGDMQWMDGVFRALTLWKQCRLVDCVHKGTGFEWKLLAG